MEKKGTFCVKILAEKMTFFCLVSVRLSKLVGSVYLVLYDISDWSDKSDWSDRSDKLTKLMGVSHFFTLSPFHLFTFSPLKGVSHLFTFSLFHPFTFKRALAIFSPFHLFTFSPLKGVSHLFTFSLLKAFSPLIRVR